MIAETLILRAEFLESRQSFSLDVNNTKLRYSAPSFWNQGKAGSCSSASLKRILRAEFLESRQSGDFTDTVAVVDTPRRVFGIKAKPQNPQPKPFRRYSAPSFWNQGKAECRAERAEAMILRAEFLESRQSRAFKDV